MTYDQLYQRIRDKMVDSISIDDQLLRKKMILNFEKWFNEKYKKRLIDNILNNNNSSIAVILDELDSFFKLTDYEKFKVVFYDKYYISFKKISAQIFDYTKKGYLNNEFVLDENECIKYRNEIESLKKLISPLFIDDYKRELSECYLDLKFIEKKGNVSCYSMRMGNIIK